MLFFAGEQYPLSIWFKTSPRFVQISGEHMSYQGLSKIIFNRRRLSIQTRQYSQGEFSCGCLAPPSAPKNAFCPCFFYHFLKGVIADCHVDLSCAYAQQRLIPQVYPLFVACVPSARQGNDGLTHHIVCRGHLLGSVEKHGKIMGQ